MTSILKDVSDFRDVLDAENADRPMPLVSYTGVARIKSDERQRGRRVRRR